jgi:prolyl 4-hydroxylase
MPTPSASSASSSIVSVYTDMAQLLYTPKEIPDQIRKTILGDIYTYYRNGCRFYQRKPHVPVHKKVDDWTIDYSKLGGERLSGKSIQGTPELWILNNILSREECTDLITQCNTIRDDDKGNRSWHAPGTGGKYSRVIMINRELAEDIWSRIKPILPQTLHGYKLLYVNPYFRFSRYRKGGVFHTHKDGKNYDNSYPHLTGGFSAESLLTLNIFLNGEGEMELAGGGTTFFDDKLNIRIPVRAKAGTASLFWADQYHCGDEVTEGFKYLLRTDVMGHV